MAIPVLRSKKKPKTMKSPLIAEKRPSSILDELWLTDQDLVFEFDYQLNLIHLSAPAKEILQLQVPCPLSKLQGVLTEKDFLLFCNTLRVARKTGTTKTVAHSLNYSGYCLKYETTMYTVGSSPETPRIITVLRRNEDPFDSEDYRNKIEHFFKVIITRTPTILFALDENGIVTLSEGLALELIGYKPGQLIGQSVFDILKDRPDITRRLRKALRTRQSFTSISTVAGRTLQTHYAPFYHKNKFKGLTGIAMDITDRVRAEEQRNTLKDRVMKMAAHDIRGSLAGVVGFISSIVNGDFVVNLKPEQQEIFRMMQSNCEKILNITNDIVEVQTIGHREFQLRIEPVCLRDYFASLYCHYKSLSEKKGIKFKLESENIPQFFSFDPALIMRAIGNLILNAIEHTPKDGYIKFMVKETDSKALEISIQDGGCGIEKSRICHLFTESKAENFHPGARRLNRGLGLLIVKRIADLHEAKISVKSSPHRGSIFSILIPSPKIKNKN